MLDYFWRHGIAVGVIAAIAGALLLSSANLQLGALQDAAGAARWEVTVENIRREGGTRRFLAPRHVAVLSGPAGARTYEAEITGALARQIEQQMQFEPAKLHISFAEKGFQSVVVAEDVANQTRIWSYAQFASLTLLATGVGLLVSVGRVRRTEAG